MSYIKVPAVQDKLKRAEADYRAVIIMASTGWGKSAAVKNFYKYKNPLMLTVSDGKLSSMPNIYQMRKNIIIVDDLQELDDKESIGYIRDILRFDGVQVVLITRGMFPKYLFDMEMDLDFVRITEKDFYLDRAEVSEYLESVEVRVKDDVVDKVWRESLGYPRALFYYADRLELGENFSEDMNRYVWHEVFRYWDEAFLDKVSEEFREFVLTICPYKYFSDELVKVLSGGVTITRMAEYCRNITGRFFHGPEMINGEEYYYIGDKFKEYLLWKRNLSWSDEKNKENFLTAAAWYEEKGDTPNALYCYKQADCEDKIKELLIKNVTTHPGIGHYFDTKEYYLALPEDEIKKRPLLIAGMSMMCDLIMEPEQSEYWRQELIKYEKDENNSKELRKEARIRTAYLNIALPHKGTKGILTIMKNVFTLIRNGDISLPEMCATGNAASIMNGGLDFSEWSKSDNQIAKFMGRPLEVMLGKFGNGLVTLALAESGFEKGTMSPYEVTTRCGNGYEDALHGGKIEMGFVAVGIMVRQHIIEGQYPSAKRVLASFKEKAYAENATQLYQNIAAMEVWLSLYGGKTDMIDEYLSKLPSERVDFCITDRYRYMVKIRCLIVEERFYEALELANFLGVYYEKYERYFLRIENEFLKAVILYRMDDEHWKDHITNGLEYAREYHFVNIPAMEGGAVLPLFKELEKEDSSLNTGDEFYKTVISVTQKVASAYPDYLKYISKERVELTSREMEILSMLCEGKSTDDICEECGISYSGLKKHNRNIYKKLGAANRAEAERKAQWLGLFHRG
ncbi:MAG: LuxR C-terminal-related transcriptional regulator [Lachnospiraceae bacterium]|nr:LuxR C-terminal-related transcriptional regulator [Lachnospiraceae bacterium]